jgi:hypothetical protein
LQLPNCLLQRTVRGHRTRAPDGAIALCASGAQVDSPRRRRERAMPIVNGPGSCPHLPWAPEVQAPARIARRQTSAIAVMEVERRDTGSAPAPYRPRRHLIWQRMLDARGSLQPVLAGRERHGRRRRWGRRSLNSVTRKRRGDDRCALRLQRRQRSRGNAWCRVPQFRPSLRAHLTY